MSEITKDSSLGLKVKSLYTQEIPHGSIVSFCPERRTEATGAYGVLDEVGAAPVFKWPGLNTGFGIDVIAPYEEIQHNPVHATTNILELVRQSKLGEELTFGINTVPQKTGHFPLLKYITGAADGLGDQPDSMSWLKELNGRYSLYTGIMLEDYKMEIPALGVAKESLTGFGGHRVTASGTNPAATDATENTSKPITWSDIVEIRMGDEEPSIWTIRTSAADNGWLSVTYGNGLFVAVAYSGTGNRVMTSPDGITWTIRTSAADNDWRSVTYGNGLFVAVATTGTGDRVMTSPDGITWTIRTSAADNGWLSVTYGNGLFVAVANSGTGNRVMTSPDGITWTIRTSAADNDWYSVTYGNGLFVAVANTGTGDRVMTSPDGITWTIRTSAADNGWRSVTYGNDLFVAVATTGTGNRVMTSPDGITWTIRTSAADNDWYSVTYGNGLFVAVAYSGTGNRVMTSPDGITWTIRTSAADNDWRSVTYGNGLFVAVATTGTGNRVMTSESSVKAITHCLSDISFGFTSEIKKEIHPESSLTTKIKNVRVVSRKMFVSLKLSWVDQTFLDIVAGSTKQNLKLVIGTTPDATTMWFKGLYWDKYIAKADPKELVGDTITCIVDQPDFSYSTT